MFQVQIRKACVQDFRNLKVWEKSHVLVLAVYQLTGSFPKQEIYGITNQIRRAASSVPANIAEGCGRNTDADMARFLQMAMGSASELEYHLLLARDLKILQRADYEQISTQVVEIKRMLASLLQKVRASRTDS